MSTESTEVPHGVMEILRKRRALEVSRTEDKHWRNVGRAADRGLPKPDMPTVPTLDEMAAGWLSGLNAMRLAPWEN